MRYESCQIHGTRAPQRTNSPPHRARRAGPRCSSTQDKSLKGFQIASPRSEERLRSASSRKNKTRTNTNRLPRQPPQLLQAVPKRSRSSNYQSTPTLRIRNSATRLQAAQTNTSRNRRRDENEASDARQTHEGARQNHPCRQSVMSEGPRERPAAGRTNDRNQNHSTPIRALSNAGCCSWGRPGGERPLRCRARRAAGGAGGAGASVSCSRSCGPCCWGSLSSCRGRCPCCRCSDGSAGSLQTPR
ncbi:hypothetical protein NDU88_005056 [Pleurodeles waltl]|uniref:Uncharacterized protein n=1 Tax=Pleurodeles waltl TaxID=8319 RepID=A0AAV7QEX1_PLEWA|nr:hypothetical protein NDU88_005056 [Pleurodeles waltl]